MLSFRLTSKFILLYLGNGSYSSQSFSFICAIVTRVYNNRRKRKVMRWEIQHKYNVCQIMDYCHQLRKVNFQDFYFSFYYISFVYLLSHSSLEGIFFWEVSMATNFVTKQWRFNSKSVNFKCFAGYFELECFVTQVWISEE